MNKVYFFSDGCRDYGMFIAAKSWKEARKISLTGDYDMLADVSFTDIQGELLKDKNNKPYFTDLYGELELYQLDEIGIPYMLIEN